jgi:bud site selection protein 20
MGRRRANKRSRKRQTYQPDLDLIHQEIRKQGVFAPEAVVDLDKPGLGQFRCIACSRYFMSKKALDEHVLSKPHKRRLRLLEKQVPYTLQEALWAAGVGTLPAPCSGQHQVRESGGKRECF